MTARIGVLGAWSIDNAGDAMLGHATCGALERRLPGAQVTLFAPQFPGERWRHAHDRTRGIDREIVPVPVDDMGWTHELDALVIGGGGIINFAPAFASFLLGGTKWDGPPAAWNGVCSQNTPSYGTTAEDRERIRRCCEQLAYVSVRNATTEQFVRRCGYTGAIERIPDVAFAFVDPEPREVSDRLVIGVSLGNALADGRAAAFHDALFAELVRLASARPPAEVRLVPFGPVYGDERLHQLAAARLPGVRVVRGDGPLETWRLVGRSRLFIGARLHAIVAAIAYGVPFLALDEYFSDQTATSKLRELIVDAGLEAHYLAPLVSRDPRPKLAAALALAEQRDIDPFAPLVARWRERLDVHFDAMIRALGLAC